MDQSAPALPPEIRQRGHCAIRLADEIDLDNPPKLFRCGLLEGGIDPDGRGMDPGVKPPIRRGRSLGYRLHIGEARDIGCYRRCVAAVALYFLHQRLKTGLAARRNHYLGAAPGEAQRRLSPNAAGSAYDRDDLLLDQFKLHHLILCYFFLPPLSSAVSRLTSLKKVLCSPSAFLS